MAFEGLTEKLSAAFKKLRGKGRLKESDVKEAMREIRMALLEADVSYKVVKDFTKSVTERCVGSDVLEALSPAQMIIKIVNEELTNLMGSDTKHITVNPNGPTVVMLVGLQGAGKTTNGSKLAGLLKRQGKNPLLVACDIYRPAAIQQLKVCGEKLNIPVFEEGQIDPVKIAKDAVLYARQHGHDMVFLDTAGRLHIDEALMDELRNIKSEVKPDEIILVVDAMTGQDAVNAAQSFNDWLDIDAVMLSKLDGDARGGAALSVRAVTGKPIKFVGMGEKLEDIEPFHPDRMASRILGMGDVLSLIEKAEKAYDAQKSAEMEEKLRSNIHVDLGSDQTSLHNPWAGGYYPVGYSYDESNRMMAEEPEKFKECVQESLRRHAAAVNRLADKGMYFFDYGNAFLLEASRAGADVLREDGRFRYPSYVQDIMGPLFFDYGFGPFRWVCMSENPEDLAKSDAIAARVLREIMAEAPEEIQGQMMDNIRWIEEAGRNNLVVGSQARILYADCEGRTKIALAFNEAIRKGEITAPIVLGRDHHDVSGTDSPFRETSNIYDGSQFCADMAVHNVIGDGFRGATWVSIHNGGGVGWGEVMNGGFGMVIDGSDDSDRHIREMLLWDVNNGIARRSWARNEGAMSAIRREMERTPGLKVTLPNIADDELIRNTLKS